MQPDQDARNSFLTSWGALGLMFDFIFGAKPYFLSFVFSNLNFRLHFGSLRAHFFTIF